MQKAITESHRPNHCKMKGKRQSKNLPKREVAGPENIPTILANPKRRFTMRLWSEQVQSGSLTFSTLLRALVLQLTTGDLQTLPPSGETTLSCWRYIKLKSARAWGPTSEPGKRSIRTRLWIPATAAKFTIEPSSTRIDIATAQNDRGFDTVKGHQLSWAEKLSNDDAISYANVCVLDLDVEVW